MNCVDLPPCLSGSCFLPRCSAAARFSSCGSSKNKAQTGTNDSLRRAIRRTAITTPIPAEGADPRTAATTRNTPTRRPRPPRPENRSPNRRPSRNRPAPRLRATRFRHLIEEDPKKKPATTTTLRRRSTKSTGSGTVHVVKHGDTLYGAREEISHHGQQDQKRERADVRRDPGRAEAEDSVETELSEMLIRRLRRLTQIFCGRNSKSALICVFCGLILAFVIMKNRTCLFTAIAAFIVVFFSRPKASAEEEFRDIGIAKVDITPEYAIRLSGYGNRREESEGVAERISGPRRWPSAPIPTRWTGAC